MGFDPIVDRTNINNACSRDLKFYERGETFDLSAW